MTTHSNIHILHDKYYNKKGDDDIHLDSHSTEMQREERPNIITRPPSAKRRKSIVVEVGVGARHEDAL